MTSASAEQIATHYNQIALARHGRHRRSENDCVHLRRLNNWVKTIQILDFVQSGDCILDFCSGKGGDLGKYAKRNIGYYVGCDISFESVKEAVKRYNSFSPKFGAMLLSGDGFAIDLSSVLSPDIRFNAVSCQFSLHYAFECEERVRRSLANISNRLVPGGHFFGTLPDANVIVNRMRSERAMNPDARSFGNGFYKVTIEDPEAFDPGRIRKSNPFSHRYLFDLNDSVNSCSEWLVPKSVLVEMAKEYDLELIYWMNLHHFFVRNSARPQMDSLTLLSQMKVADSNGNIPLKEFEIAGIYVAFAFRKIGDKDPVAVKYRKPFGTLTVDDIIQV